MKGEGGIYSHYHLTAFSVEFLFLVELNNKLIYCFSNTFGKVESESTYSELGTFPDTLFIKVPGTLFFPIVLGWFLHPY